jgi:hypothetical protein
MSAAIAPVPVRCSRSPARMTCSARPRTASAAARAQWAGHVRGVRDAGRGLAGRQGPQGRLRPGRRQLHRAHREGDRPRRGLHAPRAHATPARARRWRPTSGSAPSATPATRGAATCTSSAGCRRVGRRKAGVEKASLGICLPTLVTTPVTTFIPSGTSSPSNPTDGNDAPEPNGHSAHAHLEGLVRDNRVEVRVLFGASSEGPACRAFVVVAV